MKAKIKDYEYVIVEVEYIGDNTDIVGNTDNRMFKISLVKDLDCVSKRKTLIHELTHAFIYSYGFSDYEFKEENVCYFFETYSEDILKIVNDYFNRK